MGGHVAGEFCLQILDETWGLSLSVLHPPLSFRGGLLPRCHSLVSPPKPWKGSMLDFWYLPWGAVLADTLRHQDWGPWCQRRPQLTSICNTPLGKFSAFPFFYPHLCWEQEAIEPRLKHLQNPSQYLPLSMVLPPPVTPTPSFGRWNSYRLQGT